MSANRSEVAGLTLAVASLTEEAGALLQQLVAQHSTAVAGGGEGLTVTLRMPAEGLDWSSLALWLIATGTVTAGALWAGQGHLAATCRESGTPSARKAASDVPTVTISSQAAVGFVVVASGVLVALFFFLDKWLAYILVSA